MTKKFIIRDFLPPPKMKKKTKAKLLSKQRNIKILSRPKQLKIKKIYLIGSFSPTHKKLTRTKFTIEDISPKQPSPPKERKQFLIIDKTPSPPKQPSPPKERKQFLIIDKTPSPPKQPSPPKERKQRKQFLIIDKTPSPPKQPSPPKERKQRKQFLIIDKTPSPPKQQNVLPPTHVSASELASNQCCSCFNRKKINTKDPYCVWCELHNHFEKCFS